MSKRFLLKEIEVNATLLSMTDKRIPLGTDQVNVGDAVEISLQIWIITKKEPIHLSYSYAFEMLRPSDLYVMTLLMPFNSRTAWLKVA